MNPSKQAHASGQFQSVGNQKSSMQNTNFNQNTINLMGETVFNTVYQSQTNQNTVQSSHNVINNPTITSKYQPAPQQRNNIDNNLSINPASSKFPMPQNQSKDLSIFKTVATGTQILPGSVTESNNRMSQNLNMNSVMKNGKALNNIDINVDTQSMVMSSNRGNQSNFPQASNSQYNNQLNTKAQSIHVSKDPSMMNQSANLKNSSALNPRSGIKNSAQSIMTNTLKIPSNQNPAALQSQQDSAMQSNLNNINASNQSMKNSFPMPPNNSIAQSNNHNQSIKPISGTMKLPGNNSTHFNPSIKNQSALNRPPNAQMSNIPNTNPIQSAMINQQHPNLALNRQNMQSVQSNLPQNSIHNPSQIPNASMKNSLTPQQQQSMMQSQKLSKMSQNPNMSVHNSKMNNSSLRKSDIKASRNKSPPLVVSTKDGQKVSTQSDSHGNPYSTTEDIHQSMKIQQKKSNDKMDEVKDINDKKITGTGFRFYGSVSKAGRNQNGDTKQNQDTPLVHPNVGDVKGFNMFGVLDGHGPQGHFVSQFCKNYFIRRMNSFVIQCKQENITTAEGLYEKLKKTKFAFIIQAFKDADLEMTKQNQFEYNFSGTTCNIVFQFKKNLICASVGDSRGILIYDNDNNTNQGIFPLSHDHKPDLPQEMNRIMNNGGRVDKLTDQYGNKVGPNRVFKYGLTYPGLAMSRSLGDFEAKECGVITEPEIIEYKMNHNSKYMVICSDGVWEFLKNENVRDLGNVYYQKGEVGQFCTSLVKKAVETWEQCDIIRDDITVVCVYF